MSRSVMTRLLAGSDNTRAHGCAAVGRSRKRLREEAIDVTPPRNQKLSSPRSSPSDRSRTPRVQPKLSAKVAIGNAAITHRDSVSAARGCLGAFVFTRWGCGHCHPDYDRMLRMVRRCITIAQIEAATGDALQKPGKRIVRGGSRCRVNSHHY